MVFACSLTLFTQYIKYITAQITETFVDVKLICGSISTVMVFEFRITLIYADCAVYSDYRQKSNACSQYAKYYAPRCSKSGTNPVKLRHLSPLHPAWLVVLTGELKLFIYWTKCSLNLYRFDWTSAEIIGRF